MVEVLLWLSFACALSALIVGVLVLRGRKVDNGPEKALREEFERSRSESQSSARESRTELSESVARLSHQVAAQMSSIATVQNNQIDAFSRQLVELTTANERRLAELRETVDKKLGEAKEDARQGREESAGTLKRFSEIAQPATGHHPGGERQAPRGDAHAHRVAARGDPEGQRREAREDACHGGRETPRDA